MPNTFKSLTDILKKDKAFSKFRNSVEEQNVVNEFYTIFPDLKKTVMVSNVKSGVLFINVENSVLRNEIYLHKNLMTDKINKYFGADLIKDIKFTHFRKIYRKKSD